MKASFSALLILCVTTACTKTEPIESGCDCQGPSNYILKDELAVYRSMSIDILSKSTNPTYCNPDFVRGRASDNDTVYVSGIIRGSCAFTDIDLPRLDVTSLRKK